MSRRAAAASHARSGLAIVLLFAGAVVGAEAQSVPMSAADQRLAEIFSGLGPDDPVRVGTPSFFVEDALVGSMGADYVELRQDGTTVDIGFLDIRSVSVQKSHWLQGTLWGAGAGILVGSVAGLMIASFDCTTPDGCGDAEREGVIRWGTVLGVGGALGGFLIGRRSLYWSTVFP